MPSKRSKPNFAEQSLGIAGTVKKQKTTAQALDYFMNQAARTGYGNPNLGAAAQYELVRFSYDYWQLITLYRNHWISRRIVDTPAQDMVRAWPKLTSDVEPKDLSKLDRAIRRTMTRTQLLTALQWGRLFGGAGCLMVIDGQEDQLDEPLDLDSIPLGGYKGLIPFDRWAGISPSVESCNDFNRPLDFGKPEYYECHAPQGGHTFKVHASRILRCLGPEVPTPEKEAQSLWGIAVLEPVFEEIQKRDNMSWNILNLTFRANILGMKFPDLASLMSGLGMPGQAAAKFEQRMSAINQLISNQSLVPLPADGGIESTQYSFAGVSEVYQQFQLDISGAAQIPVTRLWGRTISGLGQANDADERIYEERIATDQEIQLRPQMEKLYPVLCMSELGQVPDDLDLTFPSVRVLDEKEKSELAKATVDTVTVALNSGGISLRTYAQELKQSSDITGVFTNITDEMIAKLPDEVASEGELGSGLFGEAGEGEEGEGTQLTPSSGPQKVLREEKGKAADSDGQGATRYVHGLECVIETPKGRMRHGDGWSNMMPYDYGYLKGVLGADGDSLDVAVDPKGSSSWIYCFDQYKLGTKKFEETKCFLNYASARQAMDAFKAGHHKADDVLMDWTPMTVDSFKHWIKHGDLTRPCSVQN